MPEHWEEAWLEATKGWHDLDCRCGNWQDHLWLLLADGDAALAAAVDAIERDAMAGDDATTATGRVTIGDDGCLEVNTNPPQESGIHALIHQPILCRSQEVLHTPNSPEKEECSRKQTVGVSLLPLPEPSVQIHPQRQRKVHFSEGTRKRKERKPRKPRHRPVSRVPKALLREMDRLMMKRQSDAEGGPGSDSDEWSESSLTDEWTTSDSDFIDTPIRERCLNKKQKKR
ncbi:ORF3 [Torque teno sus virus 1b]|uniref:ORF3 n=1 Tax=Torque teno sus virus 1b TaxID=687387 RepID=Q5ENW9_9VIRU|nr:ORF3 [Torque teno sus virus 1b]AAW79283.1 ORF3 [Torque teno sus virus 1b]